MYIVLSILFFFVVVAASYQVVQRVLRPMENATDRRWLIGVSCAVSVVASVLLLSCAFLPYKMNNALEEGISAFEQSLESVSPDICNEELSPDRLRQLCSDSRSIKGYIEENADVNFVVRTVGVDRYVDYLVAFANGMDGQMDAFEQTGAAYTIHNVLAFIQQEVQQPIRTATMILEGLLLLAMMIVLGAVCIIKKMSGNDTIDNGVRFGEGKEDTTAF